MARASCILLVASGPNSMVWPTSRRHGVQLAGVVLPGRSNEPGGTYIWATGRDNDPASCQLGALKPVVLTMDPL
jgi:hypothetical protein